MNNPAEFDYQAAQHQDMLLFKQATIERLLELRLLVDACDNHTTLNQVDVEGLAIACGLHDEFKQAIKGKYEKRSD